LIREVYGEIVKFYFLIILSLFNVKKLAKQSNQRLKKSTEEELKNKENVLNAVY
jgi:hypothetical protein